MNIRFLLLPVVAAGLLSCRSIPSDVAYFQDFDSYIASAARADSIAVYDAVIRVNDQLMISVSSPVLDQTQVAQFNLPVNVFLAPGETMVSSATAIQTYTVDTEGNIVFPVVGKIHLAGLTRSQAVDLIVQRVSPYLPDPLINFQILGYKITILGEVNRPGRISVNDGRLSIFDALGSAGDLTIYGDRRNVILIREIDGAKEYYRFDLTSSRIFDSPYYYLRQNDVIYVTPNDIRKMESRFGQVDNYRMSVISLTLGSLSLITSTVIAVLSITSKK
jgi:polysaccharide export outer membrane protein